MSGRNVCINLRARDGAGSALPKALLSVLMVKVDSENLQCYNIIGNEFDHTGCVVRVQSEEMASWEIDQPQRLYLGLRLTMDQVKELLKVSMCGAYNFNEKRRFEHPRISLTRVMEASELFHDSDDPNNVNLPNRLDKITARVKIAMKEVERRVGMVEKSDTHDSELWTQELAEVNKRLETYNEPLATAETLRALTELFKSGAEKNRAAARFVRARYDAVFLYEDLNNKSSRTGAEAAGGSSIEQGPTSSEDTCDGYKHCWDDEALDALVRSETMHKNLPPNPFPPG